MTTEARTGHDRVATWLDAFADPTGWVDRPARGNTDPGRPLPAVSLRTPGQALIRSKRLWEAPQGNHLVEFAELAPGDRKCVHREHHAETVWIILEGEGEFYPDFETAIPIGAGSLCHAYPWEWHGMGNTGAVPLRYISVEGPKFHREGTVDFTE